MANDLDIGTLSGDGILRSQLANATESTGAAAVWAGEIAKMGSVLGRRIGVAIIDSGVDRHTALAGRIVASVDFTRSGGSGQDQYGHGTHVAGIVAAGAPANDTGEAPVGMAPGAHIVSLKVLEADGTGKVSNAIRAIDWAIEHKAQYGIRIINLSLGHGADAVVARRSAVPGGRARGSRGHRRRRLGRQRRRDAATAGWCWAA